MVKKLIIILVIITLYISSCYLIYNEYEPKKQFIIPKFKVNNLIDIKIKNEEKVNKKEIEKDKSIGLVQIPSISLEEKLYPINSNENNVDKNVTILKGSIPPSEKNSIFFLAAHSGTGPYAYFKNLNKVNVNDKIILKYELNEYIYIVKDIWETDKDGDIEVQKTKKNQLILTTCSPTNKDKQLVINCTKKES